MKIFRLILSLMVFAQFSVQAFASGCEDLLLVQNEATIRQWSTPDPQLNAYVSAYRTAAADAFRLYESLVATPGAKSEDVRQMFKKDGVLSVLLNDEMPGFAKRLKAVFEACQQSDETVASVLARHLEGKVPARQIQNRIQALISTQGSTAFLRRALGEMELTEVHELVHGGDLFHPSPDSLLGKYLAETGAQMVVRSFSQTGQDTGEQGQQKLVIAVSEQSFPIYQKYFGRQEFMVHTHSPSQGTLYIGFNGASYSWGGGGQALRAHGAGSLWPHIMLKTTEAERAANYFALHTQNVNLAMRPWESMPTYCAVGAYTSCTHWFGNLPIGDRKVTEYRFPGFIDQYASNHIPDFRNNPAGDAAPRVKPLEPHSNPDALVKMVFQAPGHEQLAGILDTMPQQEAGEYANPGWVLLTLTSRVGFDRVPFVFYFVTDHRAPLTNNFSRNVNAY